MLLNKISEQIYLDMYKSIIRMIQLKKDKQKKIILDPKRELNGLVAINKFLSILH